jgi:hypothetical protein
MITRNCLFLCLLAAPAVLASGLPPVNPWLATSSYAVSHHNPAQSDATAIEGPSISKKLTLAESQYVPLIWSSAPTYKHIGDDTVVIASSPGGIKKIRASGDDFTEISNMAYPGQEDINAAASDSAIIKIMNDIDAARHDLSDWRILFNSWWMYWKLNIGFHTMPNGAYQVIDKNGYHYTNYNKRFLVKSFDNNEVDAPLVAVAHRDIVAQLPPEDAAKVDYILGIGMTYDGHIVAAATGTVIITDRDLNVVDHIMFPGEWVENSIAVDENNGIYVVTSQNMYKLAWTGSELSTKAEDGAWKSPYEVMPEGEARGLGAASHGSGTTPSLMGFGDDDDKLVVISDGSPDGANVVAFWRDEIPADFQQKAGTLSRRIADQIALTISPTTIEASPVAYDNGILVVNSTYPEPSPIPQDLIASSFVSGVTRPPPVGIQKYEWLPEEDRFIATWSLDNIDNTDWMPPAVSEANGLVYIANKKDQTYEYLAADWKTGEIKATWEFPDNSVKWNNWGGITVFLEDGDFLLGGFFGVKRFDTSKLK